MKIRNNNINLKDAGIINVNFPVLKKSRVIKLRNSETEDTIKEIKKTISSESIMTINFFSGVCESGFYKKIIEKHNVFERSNKLFPDLIFLIFKATNFEVTNIRKLETADIYLKPHFNLVFNFVKERKKEIIDGIFPNSIVSSLPEFVHWKYSNLLSSLSKSEERANSPSLISCFRAKAKPNFGIIHPQLRTPKLVSESIYSRNDSNDESGWKIRGLEVQGFRHSHSDRGNRTYLHYVSLFQAFLRNIWLSEGIRMKILDTWNPPYLPCKVEILSVDLKVINEKISNHKCVSFLDTGGMNCQKADFLIGKLQYGQKSSELQFNVSEDAKDKKNAQKGFLIGKLYYGQKSSKLPLNASGNAKDKKYVQKDFLNRKLHNGRKINKFPFNASEDAEVVNNAQNKSFFPQNNTILEYACPWHESAPAGQITRDHLENNVIGKKQDILLRKPVSHVLNNASRVFEKDEPEYTSKDITRILSQKSNSSVVSPGEINTIADKVYKLLESKLLIEKERRGLR